MYSDQLPPLVMPDSETGHYEARMKFPGVFVGFCHDYEPDPRDARMCGRRNVAGDRRHNWCTRCLCGYIALNLTEQEQEATRLGDIRLNW